MCSVYVNILYAPLSPVYFKFISWDTFSGRGECWGHAREASHGRPKNPDDIIITAEMAYDRAVHGFTQRMLPYTKMPSLLMS